MANKPRKMLGDKNAPCTRSLLQLIEAQDKPTVCKWCLDYAEAQFLPIFESRCHGDCRPRNALNATRDYLGGKKNMMYKDLLEFVKLLALYRSMSKFGYPPEVTFKIIFRTFEIRMQKYPKFV